VPDLGKAHGQRDGKDAQRLEDELFSRNFHRQYAGFQAHRQDSQGPGPMAIILSCKIAAASSTDTVP
jgi:hypothetical protein